MTKKHLLLIWIRIATTIFIWISGLYILNKYEYLKSFMQIDNVIGMLPVALVITGASLLITLIWIKHTKPCIPLSIALFMLAVVSIALIPTALKGNWWINTTTSNAVESAPDLSVYEPFSLNSKIAKLSSLATLQLDNKLPILDGATALYPIYAAFANAVYNQDIYMADDVLCTNTKGAYEAIIAGERDIVFVAGASEKQIAAAKQVGVDLHFTPIGKEAFVF